MVNLPIRWQGSTSPSIRHVLISMTRYPFHLYDFFPFLFFDKGAQEDLPAVEIITELTKAFPVNSAFFVPTPMQNMFPPTSFILFVVPCRYIWDFKTQILKHLHENKLHIMCRHLEHLQVIYYKCKYIQSNIISNYVLQTVSLSVFIWRQSSVWSLGYHGSIMSSVSVSYSFYVKMISD